MLCILLCVLLSFVWMQKHSGCFVSSSQDEEQWKLDLCTLKYARTGITLKAFVFIGPRVRSLATLVTNWLTSTNLTMIVMERARLMSSPVFEILTFANEFLNCCIKYRNEPFGGWQELSGLVESQEGGVPYVSNAGKERPVCFLKNNFFLRTLNTCICQSSCGY